MNETDKLKLEMHGWAYQTVVDSHFVEEVERMSLAQSASFRDSCIVFRIKVYVVLCRSTRLPHGQACSVDACGVLNYFCLYIRGIHEVLYGIGPSREGD